MRGYEQHQGGWAPMQGGKWPPQGTAWPNPSLQAPPYQGKENFPSAPPPSPKAPSRTGRVLDGLLFCSLDRVPCKFVHIRNCMHCQIGLRPLRAKCSCRVQDVNSLSSCWVLALAGCEKGVCMKWDEAGHPVEPTRCSSGRDFWN